MNLFRSILTAFFLCLSCSSISGPNAPRGDATATIEAVNSSAVHEPPDKFLKEASVVGEEQKGVSGDTDPTIDVRVFPTLGVNGVRDYEKRLDALFDDASYEVVFSETKETETIRSCRQFLSLPKSKFDFPGPEPEWNSLMQKGIECVAISWIMSATPSEEEFPDQSWNTPDFFKALPPFMDFTLVPEEAPALVKAIKSCQSWAKYSRGLEITGIEDYKYKVSARRWEGEVTIYATGDFNSDGTEDLLIRRDAWPIGGSMFVPSLFVVSWDRQKSCYVSVKEYRFP